MDFGVRETMRRHIEMNTNSIPRKILSVIALTCLSMLTACGSNSPSPDSDFVSTGAVLSVSCDFAWADCYSEAQRRCANGDFEEIDRNAIERVTADIRSNRSMPVRIDSMNQTITIRCK